jgi:radical SAM protein with 4Fe4S-binding SPASM domain
LLEASVLGEVLEAPLPILEKPIKITISITNVCNLNCTFCYSDCTPEPEPAELTADEWKRTIDQLADDGVMTVFFEGGEPLCRSDFLDIVSACSQRVMVWVRTNGTLISNRVAVEMKRVGVGMACVDILGARAGTHDTLTGSVGSFARAVEGVRHLVNAGVPTSLLMILNRVNATEIQDYLELAQGLGVCQVSILRLYPLGRAKRKWRDLACSLDEMMDALKDLKVPSGLRLMQSWHPRNGNCCWENAALSHTGISMGCPYLREYVDYGNIRQTTFMQTWNHPLYLQLRTGAKDTSGHCEECSSNEKTLGGCRATAYAFHRDWNAVDPFCTQMNRGVNIRDLPEWLV